MTFTHPALTVARPPVPPACVVAGAPAFRLTVTGHCVKRQGFELVGDLIAFTASVPQFSRAAIQSALGPEYVATDYTLSV